MITFEMILLGLIAAAPSVAAITGIVSGVCNMRKTSKKDSLAVINKLEEVRKDVLDAKEYAELKDELRIAHQENRELRRLIKELLIKTDCINRTEE